MIKGDEMELKIILGKNIKYHRYKKKLTQEKLAELLNISPNYIGRLERGKHNPSLEKIEEIAATLDIKPFELFLEHEDLKKLSNRVNLKQNVT